MFNEHGNPKVNNGNHRMLHQNHLIDVIKSKEKEIINALIQLP
jgi:hypothetical protein